MEDIVFAREHCQWLYYPFITILLVMFAAHAGADWHRFSDTAMTTKLELEFWHKDAAQAERIAEQVFHQFHFVNQTMSRYESDSELSMVNALASDKPVAVSPELFEVLSKAIEIGELSGGAFDISYASVGYLYDYRAGQAPDKQQIAALADAIDYRKIKLDPASRTVYFEDKRMVVDLGGIAKGYAVDLGVRELQSAGIRSARLSAGGDMYLLGDKGGRPWVVGVKDPRREDQQAVVLPLSDVSVSTSGDYERYFINESGERVHHLISPRSGEPVKGVQSVTVIGKNTMLTDALSTAVFVLGVDKGLALINQLPEIDAIIVDERRTLRYSGDLAAP